MIPKDMFSPELGTPDVHNLSAMLVFMAASSIALKELGWYID